MAYNIIVSPRAQKEIENAIDYYAQYNTSAPLHFVKMLTNTYASLEKNPFYNVRYKDIRALKIYKFPYSIYFVINQSQKVVKILSCFHNKIDPVKRPKV